MSGRVLLTGASGFLGGAILDRLVRRPDARLRLLEHRSAAGIPPSERVEAVRADLADPGSLAGLCRGIDTVIHAASVVGDDEPLGQAVNGAGTEALVEEARAAGVGRFLYLSNAAVYGFAVHRGAAEEDAAVHPATAVSRSRARAEKAVLAAGGAVLRPLFVFGTGDRTFLPALIRWLERRPFLVRGGRARVSVIAAGDLASAVEDLALRPNAPVPRGAYHVNDGRPIAVREIARALSRTLGVRRTRLSLPYPAARLLLKAGSGGVFGKAGRASAVHRLFLVAYDHFYDAGRLWSSVGVRPGPPLPEALPAAADWYARFRRGTREGS